MNYRYVGIAIYQMITGPTTMPVQCLGNEVAIFTVAKLGGFRILVWC